MTTLEKAVRISTESEVPIMRFAIISVVALLTAGSASAAELYVGTDGAYARAPARSVAPADEVYIRREGPRVYGWREWRPENCGTFKYWNGEYCADAREPPPKQ
jgi:hypothetical protein